MRVLGQFRDLDRPDRFVWLRGFADAAARRAALTSFYDGPVWAKHGPAANDTMVDWHDVLLLRPVLPFRLPAARPTTDEPPTRLMISVHPRADEVDLARDEPVGLLVSDPTLNTFPRLPVREGEDVAVRFGHGLPPVPGAGQLIRAESTGRSWLR